MLIEWQVVENKGFFSLNLSRLLEARGWSYEKLAEKADVGMHTVFRAVSKGVIPRGANIAKIAKALGVTEAQLFSDPNLEQSPEMQTAEVRNMHQEIKGMISNLKPSLNPEESLLVERFGKLNDSQRRHILGQVEAMVGINQSKTVLKSKRR